MWCVKSEEELSDVHIPNFDKVRINDFDLLGAKDGTAFKVVLIYPCGTTGYTEDDCMQWKAEFESLSRTQYSAKMGPGRPSSKAKYIHTFYCSRSTRFDKAHTKFDCTSTIQLKVTRIEYMEVVVTWMHSHSVVSFQHLSSLRFKGQARSDLKDELRATGKSAASVYHKFVVIKFDAFPFRMRSHPTIAPHHNESLAIFRSLICSEGVP